MFPVGSVMLVFADHYLTTQKCCGFQVSNMESWPLSPFIEALLEVRWWWWWWGEGVSYSLFLKFSGPLSLIPKIT